VRLDVAWTRRQSDRDALYANGGNIIRPAGASRARAVGRDVGVALAWSPTRHVTVLFLPGRYFHGEFLRQGGAPATAWTATTFLGYRF
jgi:hypothetical protein